MDASRNIADKLPRLIFLKKNRMPNQILSALSL